ncbi:hypothetical protein, partial [Actinomadura sp. WAC 06369]|uniref:hypothetical protein n=1 Tax=Actinomadura sp. WAC 06369 TaxID=2203193 RepID=UPI00100188DB
VRGGVRRPARDAPRPPGGPADAPADGAAGAPPPPHDPSWIEAECRRRFRGDPARRSACVAALRSRFGG